MDKFFEKKMLFFFILYRKWGYGGGGRKPHSPLKGEEKWKREEEG